MAYPWVFPSDNTGVRTTPVLAKIIREEIGRWDTDPGGDATWNNLGNGFETYFTTAARVGIDPETVLIRLKKRIAQTALPNLWIPQSGGLTETLSGVPSCINEMLLQSYEGMIRLFPAWPASRDARFDSLRTYGAFLVSSEKRNGTVQWVNILSEKGRICRIENPWPGQEPVVRCDRRKIAAEEKGQDLMFPTEAGRTYSLEL